MTKYMIMTYWGSYAVYYSSSNIYRVNTLYICDKLGGFTIQETSADWRIL